MSGCRQKMEPGPGKLFMKETSLGRVHDPVRLPLDDDCPGGQAGKQGPEVTLQQIIEAHRQGPGGRRHRKRLPGLGSKRRLPRGQTLFGKLSQHLRRIFYNPPAHGPDHARGLAPGIIRALRKDRGHPHQDQTARRRVRQLG